MRTLLCLASVLCTGCLLELGSEDLGPLDDESPGPLSVEASPSTAAWPDLLEERTQFVGSFQDPQKDCAGCHEQHVREWEISNHAYAFKDPVFKAMTEVAQAQSGGKVGQFCVQCHSPTGLAMGQTPVVEGSDGTWRQDFEAVDAVGRQGVSCDVCHSITEVIEPVNARMALTPDGIKRGGIQDPVPTDAHGSAYSELHQEAEVCGSCHAVTSPKGALIEETFGEYTQSSAAAEGKTCQSCHMPAYTGRATEDAPERELHRHLFVGVDVSLLPPEEFPGYGEMRLLTAQLLRESALFGATWDADSRSLKLSIENRAGHALPSGATAERQMWVEAVVRNVATGEVVFESGTLDAQGDLRDGVPGHSMETGTDPQLIVFGQQLVKIDGFAELDVDGKAAARTAANSACIPPAIGAVVANSGVSAVTFPWQADWQCNYLVGPDETVRPSLSLAALPPGSYRAEVRLLFRTFPPYFLRVLEASGGLDPQVKGRVPVVEMATESLEFLVP